MQLTTPRLILRELEEDDFEALHELDSDAQTWRFEHPPLSETETRLRLQRFLASQLESPRSHYYLALQIPPDRGLKGLLKLTPAQPHIREYEIGWAVRREEWGKGYASEAARVLLAWAFEQLAAHRVIAFCHAENRPSERVMQKLGMQREGRTRETVFLEQAWCDELIYAILEREYHPPE
jgi:[ribosomal protein S5]-alanine N-acetyltransferase